MFQMYVTSLHANLKTPSIKEGVERTAIKHCRVNELTDSCNFK